MRSYPGRCWHVFLSCFRVCFCRRGDCSTTLYFFVAGILLTLLLDIETKIHVFKEFVLGIHVFTVGFVGVICQTTFMIFGSKGAANLIVTSPLRYSKEPTCLRWPFPDFHVPLYRNKRLCKTMQCGDPRYPMRRSNYPVSYSCCSCSLVIWFSWVVGPLVLSVYRGYWEPC